MPATAAATGVKFHFGLNVADLKRSVAFYRTLFGLEPAKSYDDYAKFELTRPPLVMSLLPNAQLQGGTLNHLGFRLPDSAALVEVQARLEHAGIATQREEGVECCYARQTKFWVTDPDRNLWEMYVFEEDIDHHGLDLPPGAPAQMQEAEPAVVWEHRLGQPLPSRLPYEDGAVDEVRFEGTWCADLDASERDRILAESRRVLRPGGTVMVHGLVADKPLPGGAPNLPGPAAVLQRVPLESEPVEELGRAGFTGLHFTKLADSPCFVYGGVEMREMRLRGRKPEVRSQDGVRQVLYKGPFRQVADDEGQVYLCGERVAVSACSWEMLRQGPAAGQFIFFTSAGAECSAGCQDA
jgi:catechol 2,3-dioxygenase-like lactoylglutathione lyase family enzyme